MVTNRPIVKITEGLPVNSVSYVCKILTKEKSSYIARYPVLRTAQVVLHFTPDRPVPSNTNSTSTGSIQPSCSYCTNTIFPRTSITVSCHELISTAV